MDMHASPTNGGGVGTAPGVGRVRRGLCTVACGALAVGTCLQILAAAIAVAIALTMVAVAVAGPVAPWLGVAAAALVVAAAGTCVWRNRRRR
jgi:ABC-type nickel/cobalt efflux system permease component RcnA